MQELIKVTTNEQGSKVVSAKDLHEYLEVKKDFSSWIKHRIEKYGFIENQDFIVFTQIGENLQGGRPSTEYALTLDAAKELSMVEGNKKGKEARQYFIECEKQTKELMQPISQVEALLQSVQILATHDKRILAVETKLAEIEQTRNEATQLLLEAERSTEQVPEETTRVKIRRLINQYARAKNADYQSVWHVVYDRLYYRYGINLRAIVKKRGESALDLAERFNHLEKIYAICSNELV